MDNSDSRASRPCRGVIVVDANELQTLSAPYQQRVTADSPLLALIKRQDKAGNRCATGTYLDLLVVLAEHGYRIIIPEMVSKESGRVLAGGRHIDAIFGAAHKRQYVTQDYVRRFCVNASEAANDAIRYRNIDISEAADPHASYTAQLRGYDGILADRAAIAGHQQRYVGLRHEGEKHCCDVIAREIRRQHEARERIPIFFLSSDGGGRTMLEERLRSISDLPPVSVLSANGFLMALENDVSGPTNTLKLCGLSEPGEQHWEYIRKNLHTAMKLPDYYGKENPSAGYYDAPWQGSTQQFAYGTEQYPFAENVRGLATELAGQAQPVPGRDQCEDDFLRTLIDDWSDDSFGKSVGPRDKHGIRRL